MTLYEFPGIEQGTDEWHAIRRGIITASTIGQLITPRTITAIDIDCPDCPSAAGNPCLGKIHPVPIKTMHPGRTAAARKNATTELSVADNDTSRALTLALAAERITGWTEPTWTSDDMLRGQLDEPIARAKYAEHYAPVTELGFIIREETDWKIGYSPDGLIGNDGLIEIKSRRQKKQLATILNDAVPAENMAQIQAGLLVTGRKWLDYISYSGGMPLYVKRVHPDTRWHDALIAAAQQFEANVHDIATRYTQATTDLPTTERIDHFANLALEF